MRCAPCLSAPVSPEVLCNSALRHEAAGSRCAWRVGESRLVEAGLMTTEAPIYLNIGCGYSAPEGWVNIDASPTARLEKLPMIGGRLGRLSGNSVRFPPQVRYGNLVRGLLFPPNSVEAVYASHVLEHIALDDMRVSLANVFTMLRPGGRLRLIVPDLRERARRYLDREGDPNAAIEFMESCYLGMKQRPRGIVGHIRSAIGNSAHLWMWDEAAMRRELEQSGFVAIREARLGDSGDPMFERVEEPSRFDDDGIQEVALEAWKPSG